MKHTLSLIALVAICSAMMVSCKNNKKSGPSQEEIAAQNDSEGLVFTATIAVKSTRTTINATDGKVSWVSGDEITITDAASTAAKYSVSAIDAQGKATFTKVAGQPSLGVGPYTAVYGTDPAEEQVYSTTAPSLPMSAESSTTELTFTVSCGLLELTLTAANDDPFKNVNRIIVKGQPADTDKYPGDKKGYSYFTINFDPVLNISTAKTFYIALPVGNYTGVGMTNTNHLGNVITPPGGSIDIEANKIEPVGISGKSFAYPVDIKCKKYLTVTINNVVWIKENFACDKYDTESEVYTEDPDNYFLNHKYIIPQPAPSSSTPPTFKDTLKTPYYVDATDKEHTWSRAPAAKKQQTSLTTDQIARLGYSYNWAAAVGVATNILRTTGFTGKRQGICPNGWHVPSQTELDALKSYIEGIKGKDTGGHHLKSTSGWYDAGNPTKYPQGEDTYGFDLIPAGFAAGDSLSNVGAAGHILTSSPSATRLYKYYYAYGSYTNKKLPASDGAPKCNGRSLRCIKND